MASLFGTYEEDALDAAVAELCWQQHGGSGLNFTRADVLDLPLHRLNFYLEWIEDKRRSEAAAIKRARGGK